MAVDVTVSADTGSATPAEPARRARLRIIARRAWPVLTVLAIMANLLVLPEYTRSLLTRTVRAELPAAHLTAAEYVAIQICYVVAFMLVCLAVATVIYVRAAREPVALYCAYTLTALGCGFGFLAGLIITNPILNALSLHLYSLRRRPGDGRVALPDLPLGEFRAPLEPVVRARRRSRRGGRDGPCHRQGPAGAGRRPADRSRAAPGRRGRPGLPVPPGLEPHRAAADEVGGIRPGRQHGVHHRRSACRPAGARGGPVDREIAGGRQPCRRRFHPDAGHHPGLHRHRRAAHPPLGHRPGHFADPDLCRGDRATGGRVHRASAAGHPCAPVHAPPSGSPCPPSPRPRPSTRCASGSSAPWTGGSTGLATTPTRPSPPSPPGCRTQPTPMPSTPTCSAPCTRLSNPPTPQSGSASVTDHQITTPDS